MAITLNKSYLSLKRGSMYQLEASEPCSWESSNPRVRVTDDGVVFAIRADVLRPDGQATITATSLIDDSTATCKITIVNWITNRHDMQLVNVFNGGSRMAMDRNGEIYYNTGSGLYKYDSNQYIGKPPTYPVVDSFIDTPFGYFYRENNCCIYRSYDLEDWELIFTPIDPSTDKSSLQHSFPWWYDEATGKGYLFIGEYSLVTSTRHKVYRITIEPDGSYASEVVLEFYSYSEHTANNTLDPACLHIHSVCIDPYTGHLWVGTGDNSPHAAWRYSTDRGETWHLFAVGDGEKYRSLSMWFTENYIYWNMDSNNPQHIFKIKREHIGDISKRETVAKLDNGSMWYYMWAKDTDGKDFVIMAASAEGEIRDWLTRLFGIWELPDGTNIVEELFCYPSITPDTYISRVQFEPKFYDSNNTLYFGSRSIEPDGFWQMQLVKNDVDKKALARKMYRYFKAKFAVS